MSINFRSLLKKSFIFRKSEKKFTHSIKMRFYSKSLKKRTINAKPKDNKKIGQIFSLRISKNKKSFFKRKKRNLSRVLKKIKSNLSTFKILEKSKYNKHIIL